MVAILEMDDPGSGRENYSVNERMASENYIGGTSEHDDASPGALYLHHSSKASSSLIMLLMQ